jgi:hypothetical protein
VLVFAIRHRPSGLFLPAANARGRVSQRGFTHREPSAGLPRLFLTELRAKAAMRCWLQGKWENDYGKGDYYESPGELEGCSPRPCPDRKPEDMEVVKLRISAAPLKPKC